MDRDPPNPLGRALHGRNRSLRKVRDGPLFERDHEKRKSCGHFYGVTEFYPRRSSGNPGLPNSKDYQGRTSTSMILDWPLAG